MQQISETNSLWKLKYQQSFGSKFYIFIWVHFFQVDENEILKSSWKDAYKLKKRQLFLEEKTKKLMETINLKNTVKNKFYCFRV